MYKELFDKLANINFGDMSEYKKFMVIPIKNKDIISIPLRIYSRTQKTNFSDLSLYKVKYDDEFLIKQPVKDSCLLTSLYNAYPKLFNYDKRKLEKYINKIGNNNRLPKVLKTFKNITETNQSIENIIRLGNRPVILIVGFNNGAHAVALFGYNDSYYAYYENGFNDAIKVNAINQLNFFLSMLVLKGEQKKFFENIGYEEFYDYRKKWGMREQNDEYNTWAKEYFGNMHFNHFGKLTMIDKDLIDMTASGIKKLCYNGKYDFSEDMMLRFI